MPKQGAAAASRNEHRDFPSWLDDATTTAAVKSRLIANSNTKDLQIDVDTRDDVVTLSGRVATGERTCRQHTGTGSTLALARAQHWKRTEI